MRILTLWSSTLAICLVAAFSSSTPETVASADGGTPSTSSGGNDGGSSSSGTDGGVIPGVNSGTPATVDPAKACADLADAFCSRLATCSSFGLQVSYGDVATCKARLTLGCTPTFGAPGTSATPAKAAACAATLGAVSCDDLVAVNLGPACNPEPGTLADGTPCTENAQCTSTFCARAGSAACGKCAPTTTAGSACVNESCSRGTACPKDQTKCVTPVRGKVGDTCKYQEDCDLANGVGCNPNSKKCIKLTVAGGSCGASDLSGSSFAVCPKNGACSALVNGNCKAAAADGASCSDADTGPHCLAPARCVGGTCKLVDPTTCK